MLQSGTQRERIIIIEGGGEPAVEKHAAGLDPKPVPFSVRIIVQRKDVNVDPVIDIGISQAGLDKCGAAVSELGEVCVKLRIRFKCLKKNRFREKRLGFFQKHLIISPGHSHVNIIIPGNEALMTDRTQGGTAQNVVAQTQGAADLQKVFEQGKGDSLQFFDL